MPNPVILQRREKVKRLLIRGYRYTEIAQKLEVNYWTIFRDVEAIQKELLEEMEKKPLSKALARFLGSHEETVLHAWELFDSSEDEKTKLRCLEFVQRSAQEKLRILHGLGCLPPELKADESPSVHTLVVAYLNEKARREAEAKKAAESGKIEENVPEEELEQLSAP